MNSFVKSSALLGLTACLGLSNLACANTVFSIVPDRSTVNVTADGSTNMTSTVTNVSGHTVSNIFYSTTLGATGVAINAAGVSGGTCVQTQSLVNNQSCTFITRFTGAGQVGTGQFNVRFCGFGGQLCNQTTMPVMLNVIASGDGVNVTGAVSAGLPSQTSFGEASTLTFTFTNSGDHIATGGFASFSGFTSTPTNTCGTSASPLGLAAGASCTVTGVFTPAATGPHTVDVTYSNHDSSDVELTTSTTTFKKLHANIPIPSYTGNVQTCTLNATSGQFSNCVTSDPFGLPFLLNSLVLNPAGTLAYMGPLYAGIPMQKCEVNQSTGAVENCVELDGMFAPAFAFNQDGSEVFLTSSQDATVRRCTVNPDGSLSNCSSKTIPSFIGPTLSIVFNQTHSHVYIGQFSGSQVASCDYSDGEFSNCTMKTVDPNNAFFSIGQINLNPEGTVLYVTQNQGFTTSQDPRPLRCAINSDNSIGDCVSALPNAGALQYPYAVWGLSVFRSGAYAYLAQDYDATYLYRCAVDANGSFSSCVDAGLTPIQPSDDLHGAFLDIT